MKSLFQKWIYSIHKIEIGEKIHGITGRSEHKQGNVQNGYRSNKGYTRTYNWSPEWYECTIGVQSEMCIKRKQTNKQTKQFIM